MRRAQAGQAKGGEWALAGLQGREVSSASVGGPTPTHRPTYRRALGMLMTSPSTWARPIPRTRATTIHQTRLATLANSESEPCCGPCLLRRSSLAGSAADLASTEQHSSTTSSASYLLARHQEH